MDDGSARKGFQVIEARVQYCFLILLPKRFAEIKQCMFR